MATAFTPQERKSITDALLEAARRCACTEGLKKTTLEELTHSAGISKSAFYAFYPSKEHLFLQVHARWHREIFDHALQALEEAQSLPPRERAACILEKTLHALSQSDMFKNALEDFPLLERKLPPEEIQAFSNADALLVTELIERARITLLTSMEEASAIVRILLMSLRAHAAIGPHFPQALSQLVRAACMQYVAA